MNRFFFIAAGYLLCAGLLPAGEPPSAPWTKLEPGTQVHTMLEIPLRQLQRHPERYIGMVFEDQFKFYHIYHSLQDADPARPGQVIAGNTHFTARPVNQDLQVIEIEITPAQEAWMHAHGIGRQDAILARIRFKGIAPGEALTFGLLDIIEAPRHRSAL